MKIAAEKKESNIAEYILFMWQTEDLIRAFKFDITAITEKLIRPQFEDQKEKKEAIQWYEDIIEKMKFHGIEEKGHLPYVNEILTEVSYVHNMLMNVMNDVKYKQVFEQALPDINEYQKVSRTEGSNIIEACFNGLYMKMMLKLKGQTISEETEKAFESMRKVLVYLTKTYHKMQNGELNYHNN